MIVFTSDVAKLVKEAISKYEDESSDKFGESSMQQFFEAFVNKVNKETNSKLNIDTFYKHYYIRLKTHTSSEIGYSIGYLNTLSRYVYDVDYLDKFPRELSNDQEIPEFPFDHPAFPATPAIRIKYAGYKNLWIKDESYNPTGSHKDRKAHELYLFYKKIIKEQVENNEDIRIPRLSLISAGNAALAIQYRFRRNGFPNLKVLVDKNIDKDIHKLLKASGAEIYKTNLKEGQIDSKKIKELTDNEDGIDLTYGDELGSIKYIYYDWLSYECLNLNPEYLIMPFGSGDLYRNILEVHARELKDKTNSRRYFGNRSILRDCNFIGVRSEKNKYKTLLTFLMSYYDAIPDDEEIPQIQTAYCGQDSQRVYLKEDERLFRKAREILNSQKISTQCFSGIAGFIYLLQREEEGNPIDENKKIVIVNTGGDLDIFKELFKEDLKRINSNDAN